MIALAAGILLGGKGPGYEVWRRDRPGAASVFVEAVPPESLSCTVTGLVANSVGYYHIEAISGCNIRSTISPQSRLRRGAMDVDNQLIQPAPNAPHAFTLTADAGGEVIATWDYRAANAEAKLAGFNLYVTTGADPFDYPSVDHALGQSVRRHSLGTFPHGTTVRAVVRSRGVAGVEETNTNEQSAVAGAVAPAAPTTIRVA